VHPEKNAPVDRRSDLDQEGGDRPVTRRRSRNDGADHSQTDHHTRSDILDENARWNTLRQLDLLEGRIDIRSGAGAGGDSEGSWSSDFHRAEPLLNELA
jgi:hypothetical protein